MEYRAECGRCRSPLTVQSSAYHCGHDCTYCPTCVRQLKFTCPNCAGELVRRPRRQDAASPPNRSPHLPDPRLSTRRATLKDLNALAPLFDAYRQFYEQAPNLADARRFLEERLTHDESVILIAEEGETPVGFTQLYPSFTSISLGRIYVLNDLFVAVECRRSGAGALLLEAARRFGAETGAHSLELSTAVDNPAQRLYESAGWLPDRDFLHYERPLRSDLDSR